MGNPHIEYPRFARISRNLLKTLDRGFVNCTMRLSYPLPAVMLGAFPGAAQGVAMTDHRHPGGSGYGCQSHWSDPADRRGPRVRRLEPSLGATVPPYRGVRCGGCRPRPQWRRALGETRRALVGTRRGGRGAQTPRTRGSEFFNQLIICRACNAKLARRKAMRASGTQRPAELPGTAGTTEGDGSHQYGFADDLAVGNQLQGLGGLFQRQAV